MSVVRLRDGGLLVHSPLSLGQATREEIDALGPVRALAAPQPLLLSWSTCDC